jgi:hypothetical protein
MENLAILLVAVYAVVIPAAIMRWAIETRQVGTVAVKAPTATPDPPTPAGPTLPSGVRLEDYVRAGITDLSVLLAQAARRTSD